MERKKFLAVLEGSIEQLASIEHERWSHWQRYMHEKCERKDDGSLVIPSEFVERWSRQMLTPYSDLTEDEKESDREQVRQYLPAVSEALEQHFGSEISGEGTE